jgi:hypothetical protein
MLFKFTLFLKHKAILIPTIFNLQQKLNQTLTIIFGFSALA